jgi:alkanesulfonate monooxygenase SsuD/methylene tetrahydromethanopterin reductase-like flavin-dependent oxidoreductase (luciferase family)
MIAPVRHGFRTLGLAVGRPHIPFGEALSLAARAEKAGFGMIAAGEGFVESFSLMGALTQRTRVAELITTITTWTRTPATTALALATLADLSHGRYRAGFGSMPRAWSEGWHGVASSRPVERMRDFVGAVRSVLDARNGAPVDHAGPFYRVRGYEPLSAPSSLRVPIYIGATGPKMAALAGEIGDGVIFNTIHSLAWLRDVATPGLREGLAAAGRTRAQCDVGLLAYCSVADDRARAFDLARPAIAFYFGIPYFARLLRHHGWERALDTRIVTDEMVEAMTISGTPDEVCDKIRRYEGLVDWIVLVTPLGNAPEVTRGLTDRIVSTFATAPVASGGAR